MLFLLTQTGHWQRIHSIQHHDFYRTVIKTTIQNLGQTNYISELESFYVKQQKSYYIVLVSLYNHVGFGNSLLCPDGKREIYNVMGPKNVTDDIPFFGDENYLKYLIRHEFRVSYLNSLIERINIYDLSREKYPTFESFYFTVLDVFMED